MDKPCPLDLRKRVVSTIEGGMSRNQAAKQFGARSAPQSAECSGSRIPAALLRARWAVISRRRFRETKWLAVATDQRRRFHHTGLVSELAGRGLKVDYHLVWDFVHAEKLSFRSIAPAGTALRGLMEDEDIGV